jgi:hypothetical protein
MTDLVRAMAARMSVDAGEEHRPEQPRQSSATQTQSKWNLETETAPEKAQSTLTKLTSEVTSKLTARVIFDWVGLHVTPAVTLTVRFQRRSGDLASRFSSTPAALAAVLDTAPRPLIPPSQRRRKGSADGVAKTGPKNGRDGLHPKSKIQ